MSPRVHVATQESRAESRHAERPPLVLLVDDNFDQRGLLRFSLQSVGYETCEASDGRAGYEAARRKRPDLVISDVAMPIADGIELCHLLRADAELRTVPVLLVSAFRKDTESVVAALEAGADDYMEAPYDPLRLIAKVTRLIERHAAVAALRESEERTGSSPTRPPTPSSPSTSPARSGSPTRRPAAPSATARTIWRAACSPS